MSEQITALTISFREYDDSDIRTYSDRYWAKIEQEAPEGDEASLNDAAAILDAAFTIDPCDLAGNQISEDGEPELTEEEYWDVLGNFFKNTFNPCIIAEQGDETYPLYVRIYLSHRTDCDTDDPIPYTYHINVGEVTNEQYRVAEYKTFEIAINNQDTHYLEYPVKHYCEEDSVNSANFEARWLAGGTSFSRRGNILYFEEETSGILEVKYYTEFDRLTIAVPLDDNGQPRETDLLLFYKQLAYSERLYGPHIEYNESQMCGSGGGSNILVNPDCTKTQTVYDMCSCSRKTVNFRHRDIKGLCKDMWRYPWSIFDDFVGCDEVTGDMNDPAFYEERCCTSPPFPLPSCWKTYSRLRPVSHPPTSDFPPKTRFLAIGPKDGDCGEWTKEQVMQARSCCDYPLEILGGGGGDLSRTGGPGGEGEESDFCVSGGSPPFTFGQIGDGGLDVSPKGDGVCALVRATDCFCYPVIVYAKDTCNWYAIGLYWPSDGSWSSVSVQTLESAFKWHHDGEPTFRVHGFNGDNTLHSIQSYSTDYFVPPEPEEGEDPWSLNEIETMICGGSYSDYQSDSVAAVPSNLDGFKKCINGNVWFKEHPLDEGTYIVYYAYEGTGSVRSTSEFTSSEACEEELENANPDAFPVIADYNDLTLAWVNGIPPFTLEVTGQEVYLDAAKIVTELEGYMSQAINVYSNDTCGTSVLTIRDRCNNEIEIPFKSTEGNWVLDYYNPYGGVWGSSRQPYPAREGGCPEIFIWYGRLWGMGWYDGVHSYVVEGQEYKMTVFWRKVGDSTECVTNGYFPYDYSDGGDPTKGEAQASALSLCNNMLGKGFCTSWDALAIEPQADCLNQDPAADYETGYGSCPIFEEGSIDQWNPYDYYLPPDPGFYGLITHYGEQDQRYYRSRARWIRVMSYRLDKWTC